MEQYCFKPIDLSDIAEYAFVSPQHLCRLFKEYLGISTKQYLIDIRMRIAKELLVRTDRPIAKIAEYVGFASAYYFSIRFRKSEGVTPT